jgi:hypothetical protein
MNAIPPIVQSVRPARLVGLLLFLSAFYFPLFAFPADVFYYNPAATNRSILCTPLQTQDPQGTSPLYDRVRGTISTNGYFWYTNMGPGLWQVTVQAPPDPTTFAILVPDEAGVFSMDALIVAFPKTVNRPQDYSYSAAASDKRYARTNNGGLSYFAQYGTPNLTNWSQVSTGVMSGFMRGIAAGSNVTVRALSNGVYEVSSSGSGGAVPANVITNQATGVTLNGTFTGDGSGLTLPDIPWTILPHNLLTNGQANGAFGPMTVYSNGPFGSYVIFDAVQPVLSRSGFSGNLIGNATSADAATTAASASGLDPALQAAVNAYADAAAAAVGSSLTGYVNSVAGSNTAGVVSIGGHTGVVNPTNGDVVTWLGFSPQTNNANLTRWSAFAPTNAAATGTFTGTFLGNATTATSATSASVATTALSFAGNGSGITNLNASQLLAGTVPAARLPSTIVTNLTAGSTNVHVSGSNGSLSLAVDVPAAGNVAPGMTLSNINSVGTWTNGAFQGYVDPVSGSRIVKAGTNTLEVTTNLTTLLNGVEVTGGSGGTVSDGATLTNINMAGVWTFGGWSKWIDSETGSTISSNAESVTEFKLNGEVWVDGVLATGGSVGSGASLTNATLYWGTTSLSPVYTNLATVDLYVAGFSPSAADGKYTYIPGTDYGAWIGPADGGGNYGIWVDGDNTGYYTLTNAAGTILGEGSQNVSFPAAATWDVTGSGTYGFGTNTITSGLATAGTLNGTFSGEFSGSVGASGLTGVGYGLRHLPAPAFVPPSLVSPLTLANPDWPLMFWKYLVRVAETNSFQFSGALNGVYGFYPGGGYHNALYGDYGYDMAGLQWLVNTDDLLRIINCIATNQLPSGKLPNAIVPAGVTNSWSWPEGPLDFLTIANLCYYHWKQSGSLVAFQTYSSNIGGAESYAKMTNYLVWIEKSGATPDIGYYGDDQFGGTVTSGFQTQATLGYYDAYQKLAALALANGNTATRSNYLFKCSNIVFQLEAQLWDEPNSLYKISSSSASGTNDVMASAYAVWLGACSASKSNAICDAFLAQWGTGAYYSGSGSCKRTSSGTASLYAWVPYVNFVLRCRDAEKADAMVTALAKVWGVNNFIEGVNSSTPSADYLMGPALMFNYLARGRDLP